MLILNSFPLYFAPSIGWNLEERKQAEALQYSCSSRVPARALHIILQGKGVAHVCLSIGGVQHCIPLCFILALMTFPGEGGRIMYSMWYESFDKLNSIGYAIVEKRASTV